MTVRKWNYRLVTIIACLCVVLNALLFRYLNTTSEIGSSLNSDTNTTTNTNDEQKEQEEQVQQEQVQQVVEEVEMEVQQDGSNRTKWCNVEESTLREKHKEKNVYRLIKMGKMDLCLSFKQHDKFFTVKDKVITWAHSEVEREEDLIYGPPGKNLYAVVLNDRYAFRHIFKNGGTTVSTITNRRQIKPSMLEKRKLLAVVRDPIDHFLSGWAECGFRSTKYNPDYADPAFSMSLEFDERIRNWLDNVYRCLPKTKNKGEECICVAHSYPQGNFLIDPETRQSTDPNIAFLGSLKELHGLLKMVGLKYDPSAIPPSRASADNKIKRERYQVDKELLTPETLRMICEFVILDYYLFDFEPPTPCLHKVKSDIALIEKVSVSL